MRKPRYCSWYFGIGLAAFATLAGARPLLLPPTQQLQFPFTGEPSYSPQFDPLIYRVAIDGDTALVEGQRAIDTSNNRAEGVYVFERDTAGHWNYRAPLIEHTGRADSVPVIEGNVAALRDSLDGTPKIAVYERSASGWAQTGVLALPQNGYAFRIVDGAIYVQLTNISYPSCEPPFRQYRRVAGVWQQTATIGPQRCEYSRADVSQGRLVIGYAGAPAPQLPPIQIFADNGSANWPQVATLQVPPPTSWPYAAGSSLALSGNTLYVDTAFLFRDGGGNHWAASGTTIQPEIETSLSSSVSEVPRFRGNYLLLPGPEHDYEPPILQDSGPDLTYSWETLRVYRQRSDGGFDYYAKLNPENGLGTYAVSSDGRRIIASTSDSSYQTGDYQRVFIFEVPDNASFPGALQDDFESGSSARWTTSTGTFAVAQAGSTHVLRQSSVAGESGAVYGSVDWTDQAIEADLRPTQFDGADRWAGLVARRTDAQNYYYVTFRSTGNITIKRMRNGVFTTLNGFGSVPGGFVAGRNYRLRFEAVGEQLAVFVNGKGVIHARDNTLKHGNPGIAGYKTSFDLDNVLLTSGTRTLLRADGPIGSWTPVPPATRTGTWNYLDLPDHQLAFRQSSTAGDARWVSRVPTGNQVVSARVRPVGFGTSGSGQDQWVGVAARYADDSNYYYLTLRNSNRVSLRKLVGGAIQELGTAPLPVSAGAWYDLRLEVIGSRLRAFVDGELKIETSDANVIGSGRNAMIMYKAAADYTDYFVYQP
jgi:hypothetical protein